ncbi:helix-turn-helix domain-containing protein [Actinomadura sp. B10D3]|uniref:PucR family transcriptional regulator n=1 Tax=Actinomadura sp. B10D3 TaxID=3153557 RepID=UPI00325DF137
MSPPDSWDGIRRIAIAERENLDAIVDGVLEQVITSIPVYRRIPLHDLRAAVVTNVRGTLVGLAEGRMPTAADLAVHEALVEGRVHQRLPLDAILDAFRLGGQAVWEGVERQALREGVAADAVLAAAKLVWNRVDALMTSAAVAYRQAELAMVRHDQQRQSDFLRDLLLGEPDSAELSTLAPAFGLSLDRPYICFRARASAEMPLRDLRRTLAVGVPDARSGLLGIVQGDLAGILPDAPRPGSAAVAVGIGPPRKLSSVGSSFPLASRALETASAFGMTGVFRVEDVALRAAVLADDLVGDSLADRFLRPLHSEQSQGDVLESTVREFLAQGMRVDQTARALVVHPNTLRNRIHRFEEKTGADLSRIEDIVGLWWALERRALGNRESAD